MKLVKFENKPISYRSEHKTIISVLDGNVIEHRLKKLLPYDQYSSSNGKYTVSSLYFDSIGNRALQEKIDGVAVREKFRIRYYNRDTSFIRLEKKIKNFQRTSKFQATVSLDFVQRILNDDCYSEIPNNSDLVREFLIKKKIYMLHPVSCVHYERTAYHYAVNDVRITLDRNIHSQSSFFGRTLQSFKSSLPIINHGSMILEVKYNHFLPSFIQNLLLIPNMVLTAASKYAASRIYFS